MAKTKISEFSATPGNNTDIDGINISEGCAPSGINDAIRELMSQLKDFQTGAAGDSFNGPVGTTTAAAGAFTTLTTSSTVTHNGGTANGVAYLNGSKVLTTGSALTFDGTTLANLGGGDRARFGTSSRSLYFYADSGGVSLLDGAAQTGNGWYINGASNYVAGYISSSEQMRLTSTGLGIGTSSPSYKLHVYTNSATVSQIAAESASAGVNAEFIAKSTAATWRMGTNIALAGGQWEVYGGSTPSSKIVLDSSGNFISTAPTTAPTLSTNGTMVFNLTSNTNLRISVRGSDGVTRTADITLA